MYFAGNSAFCQQKLRGRVYDESGIFPIEGVSVLSVTGNGTASDSAGHYALSVNESDSVYFSYLGKETKRFPVAEIPDLNDFNISLMISVHILKELKIKPRNYKLDSIQNRIDYAKIFNYQKPTFKSVVPAIGIPFIVIDLDELIRAFQFRQKKMMLGFQKRLLEEEQQNYISHRFTKKLVSALTGLKSELLDSFMIVSRPEYLFTFHASDYEFRKYIKDKYVVYILNSSCVEKKEQDKNHL